MKIANLPQDVNVRESLWREIFQCEKMEMQYNKIRPNIPLLSLLNLLDGSKSVEMLNEKFGIIEELKEIQWEHREIEKLDMEILKIKETFYHIQSAKNESIEMQSKDCGHCKQKPTMNHVFSDYVYNCGHFLHFKCALECIQFPVLVNYRVSLMMEKLKTLEIVGQSILGYLMQSKEYLLVKIEKIVGKMVIYEELSRYISMACPKCSNDIHQAITPISFNRNQFSTQLSKISDSMDGITELKSSNLEDFLLKRKLLMIFFYVPE
jgi:hypothetical protein